MFFVLLIILFGLVSFHLAIRYGRMGRVTEKIDGPLSLPIIGNAFPFLLLDDAGAWDYLRRTMNSFYPVAKFWSLTYPVIMTRDPDDVKIMLTDKTNIQKSSNYSLFHVWAENGLLTSYGKFWQHRRKLMSAAFYPNVLKRYVEISNQQVKKTIEYLKAEGESLQSLQPLLSKTLIAITTSASIGLDDNSDTSKKELEEYHSYVHDFMEGMAFRLYRPYISQWMMSFLPVGRKQWEAVKKLNSIVGGLITKRRQYHENTGYKFTEADVDAEGLSSGERKKFAVIDHLLSAEKQGLIDKKGVQIETDTFVLAGYDTTTISTVFTLLLLSENKEAQDLARAEALPVYERCNGTFSLEDLNGLEYLERCIKESLRLYPSVPMIGRKIREELQLKNHLVPVRADIAMTICDIHRDPRFWPNPEKYDPDRFLPEEVEMRNPYTYMPFGAGPRACIGQKFAMIMLKTVVANVLCNFYLKPHTRSSEVKIKGHIVLCPVDPVEVKFIPINKKENLASNRFVEDEVHKNSDSVSRLIKFFEHY